MCGGTRSTPGRASPGSGLSPRVRGNPGPRHLHPMRIGSIPACAGEPYRIGHVNTSREVYPRVCGGTAQRRGESSAEAGLSPRVRGNHPARDPRDRPLGSIPACAGEPAGPGRSSRRPRVYPRVCGGTARIQHAVHGSPGLSPRVRGNHPARDPRDRHLGSIPACAGEPRAPASSSNAQRVYPRVCGGTGARTTGARPGGGLSPRVRGNRRHRARPPRRLGSIPACAGEPSATSTCRPVNRVYPRVCGGTSPIDCRTAPI